MYVVYPVSVHRERLGAQRLIRPSNLHLGLAGIAETKMKHQVPLCAEMSVAAVYVLCLGDTASRHVHPGADGASIAALSTFKPQLEPMAVLAQDVLEELDLLIWSALAVLIALAAHQGVPRHHIKISIPVKIGHGDPMGPELLEVIAGLHPGEFQGADLVKEEAMVPRIIRGAI